MRALQLISLTTLVLAACGGTPRPALTYAEECAENGLIIGSTRAAEAGGVVGSVFAAGGNTHSCERPVTAQHFCEVRANAEAASVKRTYQASDTQQIVAYSNQVRWHVYNQCTGTQQPVAGYPQPQQYNQQQQQQYPQQQQQQYPQQPGYAPQTAPAQQPKPQPAPAQQPKPQTVGKR